MPFTFAHPAAVIPIHTQLKQWISLPALVVGSLVPDAAYYLPLPAGYKEQAHTFPGSLYLALPVGLALLVIFYWVAPEIAFLLPSPHREVLEPLVAGTAAAGKAETKASAPSLRGAVLAAVGVLLGALTHILWDSFTHDSGWAVRHFAFLHITLWQTKFAPFPLFNGLEYLSSVLGLLIVLYFCDRWLQARGMPLWTLPDPSWRLYLWLAVLSACLVPAVIESHTVEAIVTLLFVRRRHFALLLFVAFIRNLLIALLALAIGVKSLRFLRSTRLRGTAY